MFEGRKVEAAMVSFRGLLAPKDRDIVYSDVVTKKHDAAFGAQLRQAALRVSAACYLEVTPSLFAAMIERLVPWLRAKYD